MPKQSRWSKKKNNDQTDESISIQSNLSIDDILNSPFLHESKTGYKIPNQCGSFALQAYVKNTALTVSAQAGQIEDDIRICLIGGSIYLPQFFEDENNIIMKKILQEVQESGSVVVESVSSSSSEGCSSSNMHSDVEAEAKAEIKDESINQQIKNIPILPSSSTENSSIKTNSTTSIEINNLLQLTKTWSKHLVIENCSDRSETFGKIIKILEKYFDLEILATRLNFYQNQDHWKPFHKDSHAYGISTMIDPITKKEMKIKEDFTVGVSFGAERSLEFIHDECIDIKFGFPQRNGDLFAFTDEVNLRFKHGVPKVLNGEKCGPRISIIGWGRRKKMTERNGGL